MTLVDAPGGGALPDGFLELPALVYGDQALEDSDHVRGLFDAANPWFAQGRAHVFCVPGAARGAAFRPSGLEIDGEPAAFFGFWETAGDVAAERLVMDALRSWAGEEGARRLYGPVNFSTALGYRVLLSVGDSAGTFVGEPHNPLSYGPGLEALGLSLVRRYSSEVFDGAGVRALAESKRPGLEALQAQGYRFGRLDGQVWRQNADELFELANAVFADNFAFTPFSREQFDLFFDSAWAASLDAELSVLAHGPEGDIAGLILMYPHAGPAGRSTVLKTGGTAPAHRGVALAHGLVAEVTRRGVAAGVETLIVATMREDNPSRLLFRDVPSAERWYGLYACSIPNPG